MKACSLVRENRDLSFDALRGVAILAVVAIHATGAGYRFEGFESLTFNGYFLLLYRQMLNFAVPTFIFISGFWMARLDVFREGAYSTSLLRRLTKVVIPYLFWSFVIFALALVRGVHISWKGALFKLVTGSASTPYYFIIVILQLYILTPLLLYLNKSKFGICLIVTINCFGILLLYFFRLLIGYELPFTMYAAPFYSWVVFYQIGLLAGTQSDVFRSFSNSLTVYAVILAILLSILESMVLVIHYQNWNFATSQLKLSSCFYAMVLITLIYRYRSFFSNIPILIKLGNISFGIYLIHMFVLPVVSRVVGKLHFILSLQPAYQIVITGFTIFLCFVIIEMVKTIVPKRISSSIFGFY
ncbi:MAG: acyltransferase [Syntrophobacteraceae bacterium]